MSRSANDASSRGAAPDGGLSWDGPKLLGVGKRRGTPLRRAGCHAPEEGGRASEMGGCGEGRATHRR